QRTIPDDEWRDISCRGSDVDTERAELFTEILGVLPEAGAQSWFALRNLERLQHGGDDHRRQCARVGIGMRVIAKVIERLNRAGHEPANCREGLGKRAIDQSNPLFNTEFFRGAAPVFSTG